MTRLNFDFDQESGLTKEAFHLFVTIEAVDLGVTGRSGCFLKFSDGRMEMVAVSEENKIMYRYVYESGNYSTPSESYFVKLSNSKEVLAFLKHMKKSGTLNACFCTETLTLELVIRSENGSFEKAFASEIFQNTQYDDFADDDAYVSYMADAKEYMRAKKVMKSVAKTHNVRLEVDKNESGTRFIFQLIKKGEPKSKSRYVLIVSPTDVEAHTESHTTHCCGYISPQNLSADLPTGHSKSIVFRISTDPQLPIEILSKTQACKSILYVMPSRELTV